MRRRRKTGNGPATKKGKKQAAESFRLEEIPTKNKVVGDIGGGMSVTAVDVVDTTTHQHFGHGHHLLNHSLPLPTKQSESAMDSLEFVSSAPNNKAVGARKRKPTQISKIVDKPESDAGQDENKDYCEEALPHNNNNNSPPYKKALITPGEKNKNGMIQNIVTELKSAKKASSCQLDSLFPKVSQCASVATVKEEGVASFSSSEDESPLQIQIEEEAEPRRKRANKKRETGKVDLANIRTLLSSSSRRRSLSDAEEDDDDGIDLRKGGNEAEEDPHHQQHPFRCGVCRFGSSDRAALLAHMKTHSGERSFQCRLCCFAFTTKANCERHLRNRHGQIEKDQIRNLVVVFSSSSSNNSDSETEVRRRSPSAASISTNKNATSGGLLLQQMEKHSIGNGILNLSSGRFDDLPRAKSIEKLPTLGGVSLVTTTDDEQPLDLSMDAVDLSTKNRNGLGSSRSSLLRPRPIYPTADIPNLLVTSPFVTKREAIVHPQLSLQMLGDEQYNGLFNGYSPFSTNAIRGPDLNGSTAPTAPQPFSLFPFGGTPPSYNPFSFPTPTMDKTVPGLSSAAPPAIPSSKSTPAFMAPSPPTSFESRESLPGSLEKEIKMMKSVKKESKPNSAGSSASSVSPTTTSRKRSDNKSGEYQKPKQRRYRTERPFSCPHCPARFTLRSNMERHGKHQHPNVWQRSPSNRVINRQQKNQQSPLVGPPTMVHSLKHSSSASALDGKVKGRGSGASVNGDGLNNVDVRAVIAQQLKRKLSNSALLNGTVGAESETDSEHNGAEGGRGADSSDLASVSQLLDRVKNSNIAQYFHDQGNAKSVTNSEDNENDDEEDMSGTESPNSGSSGDEGEMDDPEEVNDSKSGILSDGREKKKSAYSSAPHKISCPHCTRRFPWTSSLRRHLLTHTGQKPYQCSQCPLLFTTKSNCDRHLARKHSGKGKASGSGYNSTDDEDEEGRIRGDEDEGRDGEDEANEVNDEETVAETVNEPVVVTPPCKVAVTPKPLPSSSPGEDVSFRCHLCEAAASEREVLLAHMEEDHKDTYSLLVSKGALTSSPPSENSEAEPNPIDPKEATHRKVMCVFCVRRFWSVEDLRRHIRSHSGERPFSCTHCSRRFTLKHSMLRHLKKHVGEEVPLQTPRGRRDIAAKKIPNGSIPRAEAPPQEGEETNLIGRLLGIQDEGLVEKLLNKPDAKDAAKLLGLRVGLARQNTSLTTSN